MASTTTNSAASKTQKETKTPSETVDDEFRIVRLSDLRFSQTSISRTFKEKNGPITKLRDELRHRHPDDVLADSPLEVVCHKRELVSMDNRRLWCIKNAVPEYLHHKMQLRVRYYPSANAFDAKNGPKAFDSKYSSLTGGRSVVLTETHTRGMNARKFGVSCEERYIVCRPEVARTAEARALVESLKEEHGLEKACFVKTKKDDQPGPQKDVCVVTGRRQDVTIAGTILQKELGELPRPEEATVASEDDEPTPAVRPVRKRSEDASGIPSGTGAPAASDTEDPFGLFSRGANLGAHREKAGSVDVTAPPEKSYSLSSSDTCEKQDEAKFEDDDWGLSSDSRWATDENWYNDWSGEFWPFAASWDDATGTEGGDGSASLLQQSSCPEGAWPLSTSADCPPSVEREPDEAARPQQSIPQTAAPSRTSSAGSAASLSSFSAKKRSPARDHIGRPSVAAPAAGLLPRAEDAGATIAGNRSSGRSSKPSSEPNSPQSTASVVTPLSKRKLFQQPSQRRKHEAEIGAPETFLEVRSFFHEESVMVAVLAHLQNGGLGHSCDGALRPIQKCALPLLLGPAPMGCSAERNRVCLQAGNHSGKTLCLLLCVLKFLTNGGTPMAKVMVVTQDRKKKCNFAQQLCKVLTAVRFWDADAADATMHAMSGSTRKTEAFRRALMRDDQNFVLIAESAEILGDIMDRRGQLRSLQRSFDLVVCDDFDFYAQPSIWLRALLKESAFRDVRMVFATGSEGNNRNRDALPDGVCFVSQKGVSIS
ncbi:unnamed protein product [Amoebophrya sp. A120]|nr:unnamed protein product [Amoebophrya sp. A120]|eukprot:GSA120T00002975001.1